jgi:magnesium-transporting ATPase (P-type)
MKKTYKIIWGILTPTPIVMIIIGFFCFFFFIIRNLPAKGMPSTPHMPEDILWAIFSFYGLFFLGIILGFLIHISYFIHLVRNDALDKNMKTLWVVLFLVVNILAMIVYWCLNVWPEPESKVQKAGD